MPQASGVVFFGLVVCFPLMESFQDRFIAAIEKKIPKSHCPLCQSFDWAVEPGVYSFRQHISTEGGESYSNSLHSAALVCRVCGNVQFVSLASFGDLFRRDI